MMAQHTNLESPYDHPQGEAYFDLPALIARLRSAWRFLLLLMATALAVALLVIAVATPRYAAMATIAPKDPNSSLMGLAGGGLDALTGGGGLLKGILGGKGRDSLDQYLAVIQSSDLAKRIIEKHPDILPLMFPKRWNPKANSWRQPPFWEPVKSAVRSFLHRPYSRIPDTDTVSDFLQRKLGVDKSFQTSLVTLSLKLDHPKAAATVLHVILETADDIIRKQRMADDKARIAYIEDALPKVTIAAQRQALISVLSAEQQTATMLAADRYYAVDVVIPPRASATPVSPNPVLILGGAVFAAILLWLAFSLMQDPDHWVFRRAMMPLSEFPLNPFRRDLSATSHAAHSEEHTTSYTPHNY